MQRHTTGADSWLQTLDESIIGREVGLELHTAGEVWYHRIALLELYTFHVKVHV